MFDSESKKQNGDATEHGGVTHVETHTSPDNRERFTSKGAIPPVQPFGDHAPAPSASDLAYGKHDAASGADAKSHDQMADLQASTYAMLLVANKGNTDSKQGRWQFLNILDRIDDPIVRAKTSTKFQEQTGQSLREFIARAEWAGKRDKDQALALISDERGAAERNLAKMSPDERKKLGEKANGWAEQILAVTRTEDANDDENAQKIFRVLGPRSPEEIDAIRAAIRKNTHGDHSIYEELDKSLSKGNEDEAVAGLKGDPVHSASIGLINADGDAKRIKEILHGLSPAQLAELKQRNMMFGTDWIAKSVQEGSGRDEIQKLVAGDNAGATAAEITNLLKDPGDGFKMGGGAGIVDQQSLKNLEARKPENLIAELESKSPEEIKAAREAWNKDAAATGKKSWDQMIEERFRDGDPVTYLRVNALAHGDRAEDKAYALREGLRENNQKEIEDALANPDLASTDARKKAEAQREKAEIAAKARQLDEIDQHTVAMFKGEAPKTIAGRDVTQQLDDHYKEVAVKDPEIKDPFKAAAYLINIDEERKKLPKIAHDEKIASSELLGDGKLSTTTEIYRAAEKGDTKQEAALVDGIKSNAELKQTETEFKAKYGKDMLDAPNLAKFETQAKLAKLQGDNRPIPEIERDIAHDEMDANELRISNAREYGAKPERRADVEAGLQRDLNAKQYSGSLEGNEQMRAALGGNSGTQDLAREQIAVQDDLLEAPKDPFGIAPRELKPGVDKAEFNQIDQNLTTTLEVQREEKIRLSEHLAKIFSTIAKIGALLAAQPELFALIDIASGLATMAIKKSVAGEAYDPADDAKLLAIDAAVDLAMVGVAHLGDVRKVASGGKDAAAIGETAATKSIEEGATHEVQAEIVTEGARDAAGDAKLLEGEAPRMPDAGDVSAVEAETEARKVAASYSDVGSEVAEVERKLSAPQDLQARIDGATGVSKGPEYEQFKREMEAQYAAQEREAANVTEVKNTTWDGPYKIDSQYDVRTFAYENSNLTQITIDVHLNPVGNVTDAELATMRKDATQGIDRYYNFGKDGKHLHKLPNGSMMQVEVNFVDDAAAADLVVSVEGPIDPTTGRRLRTNQKRWITSQSSPKMAGHELGHQMNLVDEYVDGLSPNRVTHADGSIMGDFFTDLAPTELKPRSVARIGADIDASGHVPVTLPGTPIVDLAPPGVGAEIRTEAGAEVGTAKEVAATAIKTPEMPVVMANKGSKLTSTPRQEALRELLEEARTADVTIQADDEAQRLLDWAANAEGADPASFHAVTIGDSIFVRPEYLDNVRVLREELIHVFQQRGGIGSDQLVQGEIAARLQMIRFRHKWGITNDEVREMIQDVRTMRRTGKY